MKLGGEDRLLAWLRERIARSDRGEEPLIGDDAALLPGGGRRVVTVDSQIEGVHFLVGTPGAVVARRLLAVNLSDIAACGAEAGWALLALDAPEGFDHRGFLRSFVAAAREAGVRIAGGDLARSPGGLVATATLIGSLPRGRRFLRRSGAAAGQGLWVGGTLGESAAGRRVLERGARWEGGKVTLPAEWDGAPAAVAAAARRAVRRHLLPEAQMGVGRWLSGRRGRVGAAMDVSDGLARDLHRLCAASGVGAVVEGGRLPAARGFDRLCARLGCDPLETMLGGGEDYVLLFTLPPREEPPARLRATRIGTITAGAGVAIDVAGKRRPLPALGWDHLAR